MRGTDAQAGFVLDASIVMAWAFSDEDHAIARVAAERLGDGFALVPWHFYAEVSNGLATGIRRGRITVDLVRVFEDDLRILDIRTDAIQPGLTRFADEATAASLTAYDASYLLLARDRGLALATIDQRLAAAARQQGVPLLHSPVPGDKPGQYR